jgi:hypothetical protein
MPSRLKLTAAAVVTSGVAGGGALVLALAGALGACIDGEGLDLERPAAQDATTIREASTPIPDAATHPLDAACSPDLATDPNNCGACGHVCVLPSSLEGGADAAADGASEAGGGGDGGSGPGTSAGTLVAACMASACTVGCATGHADCNGTLADGCEVEVLADPKNCGACGVTCGSQACDAGACPYGVLVEDGGTFAEIAVNDAAVFAGITGAVSGIVEVPKDGGVPALLCHGSPTAGLALDPTGHVTFSDPAAAAIEQAPAAVPVEAGAPAAIYVSSDPRGLTYSSASPVWAQAYNDLNPDAPSVSGIFSAGALVISSTSYVRNVAATTTAVLFAGQSWIASPPAAPALSPAEDVYLCALPACATATPIAGAQYRVFDITTDGKSVFWTSWGLGQKAGLLTGCTLASCTPAPLLSGLAQPEAVVSDGSTVYWYELGLQAIRALKIPAAGADAGAPTTVASGVVGVTNLVLDATYIYWDQPSLGEIDRVHR